MQQKLGTQNVQQNRKKKFVDNFKKKTQLPNEV